MQTGLFCPDYTGAHHLIARPLRQEEEPDARAGLWFGTRGVSKRGHGSQEPSSSPAGWLVMFVKPVPSGLIV